MHDICFCSTYVFVSKIFLGILPIPTRFSFRVESFIYQNFQILCWTWTYMFSLDDVFRVLRLYFIKDRITNFWRKSLNLISSISSNHPKIALAVGWMSLKGHLLSPKNITYENFQSTGSSWFPYRRTARKKLHNPPVKNKIVTRHNYGQILVASCPRIIPKGFDIVQQLWGEF